MTFLVLLEDDRPGRRQLSQDPPLGGPNVCRQHRAGLQILVLRYPERQHTRDQGDGVCGEGAVGEDLVALVRRQELPGGRSETDEESCLGVDLRQRFRLPRQTRSHLAVEELQGVRLRFDFSRCHRHAESL
ncbi:hypothetical protein ACG93S_11600 [Streptomyces sp. WAC01490]|uniref:hypothetical protein n=1 Tax=unclassified Streptomyces TaxID=2593676 RepID=UPI003F32F3EA